MEYNVRQLSRLSGVSARTLRYYDEIGLLKPTRVEPTHYRYYDGSAVDRLQTILFYRALDMPLVAIRALLSQPGFDRKAALEDHLSQLCEKRTQLDTLIQTVQATLSAMKGELTMQDSEKFEGFKRSLIRKNEAAYGQEVRARYGDDAADAANAKLQGLSAEEYQQAEGLAAQLAELLCQAVQHGDADGALARQAFALHKQWLCFYWPSYTAEAHKGLAALYLADERFAAYYDAIAPGAARFLHDAIVAHCGA